MNRFLVFTAVLALLSIPLAQAATYVPVTAAGKSGLAFAIPYTGGLTHEGVATVANGSLEIDPVSLEISGGEINFPVTALDSGNTKRNCHIFESLGVDYTHSVYPKDHICGSANTLPSEGPDSIAFPTIAFKFHSGDKTSMTGIFSLHGVERDLTVPMSVTTAADGKLRLVSTFGIHLPDFGVVVKKFLFVTVADDATVTVDLLLQPKNGIKSQ